MDLVKKHWAAHCFGNPSAQPAERPDSMRALDALASSATDGAPLNAAAVRARCEGGDREACLAYGLMVMEGQAGVKQDMQHAADVLRQTCAGGSAKACFFLARLYDGTVGLDGRGLPRNACEASAHYRRACEGGVGQACFNFAQMLDQAKVPGERPAEADRHVQRRVAKFFGLACANGTAKGCVNLGVMQLDGFGGRAGSADAAFRTFRASCQMKEGAGCAFAADLLMQEQVPGGQAQAANLYYDGCREGHARSCKAQAMMLNQAAVAAVKDGSVKGEHAMHAKARAIMFFRRACELGDPQSCQRFFKSHDALKVLDTRSQDEKAWLNVTPEIADSAGPRTPESLQKAVYDK